MGDHQADEAREVLEIERRFIAACLAADTQTLDEILATDFVFTDPNGLNISRREWLDGLRAGEFRFEWIDVQTAEARVRGAVGTVVVRLRMEARSKKANYCGTYSAMDIYERREGRWQLTLSTADGGEGGADSL